MSLFPIQLYFSHYFKVLFAKRSPFLILGSVDIAKRTPFRYLKSFALFRVTLQSTGFIHLTVSEEKIFECFFFNILPFMGPQQPIKIKD